MKFTFQYNELLPKLAWLAVVNQLQETVTVIAGNRVECRSSFFIAGVWNSGFADGNFADTDCIFGSGALIQGDAVIFVTSAGTTDGLYYQTCGSAFLVSNSMAMVLSYSGDRLDPKFDSYHKVIETICEGINRYEKSVATQKGLVKRLFYRNLKVTRGSVKEFDKRSAPNFKTYRDYLDYLTSNYEKIYENIRDPDRTHKLEIYSTQSRGYDTTAVNSIASQHTMDKVFTVTKAKIVGSFVTDETDQSDNDDGTDISRILGNDVIPIDRYGYKEKFEDEYIYYTSIHVATELNLLEIIHNINGVCILLTGVLGDNTWSTDVYYHLRPELLGSDLERGDIGMHGLSEIGLQTGLIQLPLPYIGARRRADIFRITMSDEMAPWRLHNDYDRPIPRRIGEEIGGVPRSYFGQNKMASLTEFPMPPVPVGKKLRRQYFDFLMEHRIVPRYWPSIYRLIHRINSRIIFCTPNRYSYLYYIGRALSKIVRRDIQFSPLYRSLDGRLYCFCVNKRTSLYDSIMKNHLH